MYYTALLSHPLPPACAAPPCTYPLPSPGLGAALLPLHSSLPITCTPSPPHTSSLPPPPPPRQVSMGVASGRHQRHRQRQQRQRGSIKGPRSHVRGDPEAWGALGGAHLPGKQVRAGKCGAGLEWCSRGVGMAALTCLENRCGQGSVGRGGRIVHEAWAGAAGGVTHLTREQVRRAAEAWVWAWGDVG